MASYKSHNSDVVAFVSRKCFYDIFLNLNAERIKNVF